MSRMIFAHAGNHFRDARNLKEAAIPAFEHLLGVGAECLLEHVRVWHIGDYKLGDALWVPHSEIPRDDCAPVVAYETKLLVAEGGH